MGRSRPSSLRHGVGTFPYHSHLHELRQIGSGMYGAIIVSDAPWDLKKDHLVVAGGGGLPVFFKQAPNRGQRVVLPVVVRARGPAR